MSDNATPDWLGPLLNNEKTLRREYRRRRSEYITTSVYPANEQEMIADGWEVDRELKTKIKFRKRKPIDERLEDRFWCLLYRMGYQELNDGRNFKVKLKKKKSTHIEKQIDVFAKDDETVVVAECKASNEIKKRSFQKDLGEFSSLKSGISNAVRAQYGSGFKPKIVWLFVTEKIVWSKPDRERAIADDIHVITEREFRYFAQIVDHLGPAAKYQFLAEFLEKRTIPYLKDKKIPAVRGKLGGTKFYSFVTTPRELLRIAFVNHRALNDPSGAPTYQRLIQRSRLKKIRAFIKNGGFFPTNLLINFKIKIRFDIIQKDTKAGIHFGYLYLPDKYKTAWVIDGQHRLYGYSGLPDEYMDENIAVIAFENISTTEEANLFVTINHEQKQVARNLLDELEGQLKWESQKPKERIGAIGSRLIDLLNADIGKPLFNRVATPGIRSTDEVCLTVPEIKKGITRSRLIGEAIHKGQVYKPGPLSGGNDRETLDRACDAVNAYLEVLRDANPKRWERGRPGYLCTNFSIQAQLILFSELIKYMVMKTGQDPDQLHPLEIFQEVKPYLSPIINFISQCPSGKKLIRWNRL